jgi:hypothetical protein
MLLTDLTFPDTARTDAEDAARALAHQAERLNLPIDDIEITAPCTDCRRTGYRITLGTLTPEEAHQLAKALRTVPADTLRAVPEDAG